MIAGRGRVAPKTPNELALSAAGRLHHHLRAGRRHHPELCGYAGGAVSVVVLIALFVTLILTTIVRFCRPSASPA